MTRIEAHINNIALSHTIFDLPFALMGALLASGGQVNALTIFLIIVAVTSARAAALAINNFVDLKYDRLQPRMRNRAMVRGEISKPEALLFIAVCLLIMVVTVAQLPPICLKLLPVAALPFVIYPFTKRFTGWCHVVLGVAIAMAPAGGWMAAGGELFSPAMILLCLAVTLWMAGFDAMYGAQDEHFDRAHGLHSLVTEYGAAGAFRISRALHIACIICFALVGAVMKLGAIYFVGVAIAAAVLAYQRSIISPRDFSQVTQAYFMRNGIVSVAILICTWLNFAA